MTILETLAPNPGTDTSRQIDKLFGINSRFGVGIKELNRQLTVTNPDQRIIETSLPLLPAIHENMLSFFTDLTTEQLTETIHNKNLELIQKLDKDNDPNSDNQSLLSFLKETDIHLNTSQGQLHIIKLKELMEKENQLRKNLFTAIPNTQKHSPYSNTQLVFATDTAQTTETNPFQISLFPQHLNVASQTGWVNSLGKVLRDLFIPIPNHNPAELERLNPQEKNSIDEQIRKAWSYKISALLAYIVSTKYLAAGMASTAALNDVFSKGVTLEPNIAAKGAGLIAGIAWQLAERAITLDDDLADGIDNGREAGLLTTLIGMLAIDAGLTFIGLQGQNELIAIIANHKNEVSLSTTDLITTWMWFLSKIGLSTFAAFGAEVLDKRSHQIGGAIYRKLHQFRRNGYPPTTSLPSASPTQRQSHSHPTSPSHPLSHSSRPANRPQKPSFRVINRSNEDEE